MKYSVEGNIFKLLLFRILILTSILFSCQKLDIKKVIEVETLYIREESVNSAVATGIIIDSGTGITEHGFCWSTSGPPSIENNTTGLGKTEDTGEFTGTIFNLKPNTRYYISAFVKDESTVKYGAVLELLIPRLEVQTDSIVITGERSVNAYGTLTGIGKNPVKNHGHCWSSVTSTPTFNDHKTLKGPISSTDSFLSEISDLKQGITYYIRAYATDSINVKYGEIKSFIISGK
jgi:hypothetical protein